MSNIPDSAYNEQCLCLHVTEDECGWLCGLVRDEINRLRPCKLAFEPLLLLVYQSLWKVLRGSSDRYFDIFTPATFRAGEPVHAFILPRLDDLRRDLAAATDQALGV